MSLPEDSSFFLLLFSLCLLLVITLLFELQGEDNDSVMKSSLKIPENRNDSQLIGNLKLLIRFLVKFVVEWCIW